MKVSRIFTLIIAFLSPCLVVAQNGSWEVDLEPMPVEKWHFSSCVLDGKIYCIGGAVLTDSTRANGEAYTGIEVYDPLTNTWDMTRADMPVPIMSGVPGVINGNIFICGGYDSQEGKSIRTLVMYSPATDSWEVKDSMPTPRWGHRSAVINGKMHVLGSSVTTQSIMGIHECYDPVTNQWETLAPIPVPAWDMHVDTLGGEIYLFGGLKILPRLENIIQIYNPENDSWRTAGVELPYDVGGGMSGCTVFENKVYLINPTVEVNPGYIFQGCDDILMYDPVNENAFCVAKTPLSRDYTSAHCIDGKIYILGGVKRGHDINNFTDAVCTDVIVYHPVGDPIYAKEGYLSKPFLSKYGDSIKFQTEFINNQNASIRAYAHIISLDETLHDSILMFDYGVHDDGLANDGLFGTYLSVNEEREFKVGVSSEDLDNGGYFVRHDINRITSIGPLVFNGFEYPYEDTIPDPGDVISFHAYLQNMGQVAEAEGIKASIVSLSEHATVTDRVLNFDDIPAGESIRAQTRKTLTISEECPNNAILSLRMDIMSNGRLFWQDTIRIKVGAGLLLNNHSIKFTEDLQLNVYPNPITHQAQIRYQLPKSFIGELLIMNLTGQVLTHQQLDNRTTGQQVYTWNTSHIPNGLYIVGIRSGETEQYLKVIVNH